MGADLYITKMDRQAQYTGFEVSKRAQQLGYFRDCYNDYGLFNFIRSNTTHDLSWWQLARNKEWFNKQENMTVKGAKEFLAIIQNAQDQLKNKKTYKLEVTDYENGELIDRIETLKPDEIEYFKEWLQLLIDFLQLAIKKDSTIIWSV
jgi:hypothetical protein